MNLESNQSPAAKKHAPAKPPASNAGPADRKAPDPLGRLKALGLAHPYEALLMVPKAYRDFRKPFNSFNEAYQAAEKGAYVSCRVIWRKAYTRDGKEWGRNSSGPPFRLSVHVEDSKGVDLWATVFGNTFPWKDIGPGDQIHILTDFRWWEDKLQLANPELIPSTQQGKLIPVYRGKRGVVRPETVAAKVNEMLDGEIPAAVGAIESSIGFPEGRILLDMDLGFASLAQAVHTLHRPDNPDEGERARAAIEKLATYEVVAAAARMRERDPVAKSKIQIEWGQVSTVVSMLPFTLTGDQKQAVKEICVDLQSTMPMRRLLSGDVGCGKTATFMVPAVAAFLAGAEVAVLAQSDLLVDQLTREFKQSFPDVPVFTVNRKQKQEVRSILIGTTSLLAYAKKRKYKPDFLVVDEAQKLARHQREELLAKHTNLLEATATAIPRTQALVTHGGMGVSLLKECPVDKVIETRIVGAADRRRMMDFVHRVASAGRQVAIIYPRLDGDEEDIPKKGVLEAANQWERLLPGKVVTLHSRLSQVDKALAIGKMLDQRASVLVSTTVIEVGVTLPSLAALIVIDPQSYGLSQLHQLRGRVARGGGKGHMLLFVSDAESLAPESRERLDTLVRIDDGFALAEEDLRLRGAGDLSEDSDEQTGTSTSIFRGIKITPAMLMEFAPGK